MNGRMAKGLRKDALKMADPKADTGLKQRGRLGGLRYHPRSPRAIYQRLKRLIAAQ